MAIKRPTPKRVDSWHETLEETGNKRIKLRSLLKTFGHTRRGKAVIKEISDWLESQTPPIFVSGLDIETSPTLDDRAVLTLTKIETIGKLAPDEAWLAKRFKAQIMTHPEISLCEPQSQYSANGTRDRMDFLCEDSEGSKVVVELKYKDGDKRGVEQVLRYIGQLRGMKYEDPRGILITGMTDHATRQALIGLDPHGTVRWFIYGLDSNNKIRLKEIDVQRP